MGWSGRKTGLRLSLTLKNDGEQFFLLDISYSKLAAVANYFSKAQFHRKPNTKIDTTYIRISGVKRKGLSSIYRSVLIGRNSCQNPEPNPER